MFPERYDMNVFKRRVNVVLLDRHDSSSAKSLPIYQKPKLLSWIVCRSTKNKVSGEFRTYFNAIIRQKSGGDRSFVGNKYCKKKILHVFFCVPTLIRL